MKLAVRGKVGLGGVAISLAFAAFAPTARADILVPGSTLNFSGNDNNRVTFSNFQCNQPGDTECAVPPAGTGDFAVAGSTGSFSQYNGTFGLIGDFNNFSQPLNTLFSLPGWMTFDLNNQISLELTFLPLGTDTLSEDCASLVQCTPQDNPITPNNPSGSSGLNLDQFLTVTTATFLVQGIAHASDSSTDSFSGIFTTQFAGEIPAQALGAMLVGFPETYSGSITLAATTGGPTGIPEPLSLSLFGAGLAGASALRRRKRD